MNIAKNMETVFFAALVLAGFATFATADVVVRAPATKAAIVAEAPMATVVVSTKRLTAAQKATLGS